MEKRKFDIFIGVLRISIEHFMRGWHDTFMLGCSWRITIYWKLFFFWIYNPKEGSPFPETTEKSNASPPWNRNFNIVQTSHQKSAYNHCAYAHIFAITFLQFALKKSSTRKKNFKEDKWCIWSCLKTHHQNFPYTHYSKSYVLIKFQ